MASKVRSKRSATKSPSPGQSNPPRLTIPKMVEWSALVLIPGSAIYAERYLAVRDYEHALWTVATGLGASSILVAPFVAYWIISVAVYYWTNKPRP